MTPAEARALDIAEPVLLVEITPRGEGAPVMRFADRNITAGGERYEDYVASMSALSGELKRVTSSALNSALTVTLRNEPWGAYTRLSALMDVFPLDGAPCAIRRAYVSRRGDVSDTEDVYMGVIENARAIGLMRFSLVVSSLEFRADLNR